MWHSSMVSANQASLSVAMMTATFVGPPIWLTVPPRSLGWVPWKGVGGLGMRTEAIIRVDGCGDLCGIAISRSVHQRLLMARLCIRRCLRNGSVTICSDELWDGSMIEYDKAAYSASGIGSGEDRWCWCGTGPMVFVCQALCHPRERPRVCRRQRRCTIDYTAVSLPTTPLSTNHRQ